MRGQDNLERWESKDSEIREITSKIHHLIEKCLGNMGIEEMKVVEKRMGNLVNQG